MSLLHDCKKFCHTFGLLSCQTLLVGVSGGADSMCLLDILYTLSQESIAEEAERRCNMTTDTNQEAIHPFPRLAAAHMNHGLRGDAADLDEDIVRRYCLQRGIQFFTGKVDVSALARESHHSLEEEGRLARYSFFEETGKLLGTADTSVLTAVAHHREDQAETILMNLFRGSGPDGLCGMQPKNGNIVRPLLFASREDIVTYLDEKKVVFSNDATNLENKYTRNRWRNQILPLVKEVSRKDPVLPLLAVSDLLRTDKEYFDQKVAEIFEKHRYPGGNGNFGLPCDVLRKEHRAIASRLVRFLYTMRFASGKDLSFSHVSAVLSLAQEGLNGGRISLAHRRTAYIAEGVLFFDDLSDLENPKSNTWNTKNGQILLCNEEQSGDLLLLLDNIPLNQVVSISKTSFEVKAVLVENPEQVVYNDRTWYCPKMSLSGAVFRTKRQGDRFSRTVSSGGKPFRRFLTDRKIPSFLRERMLLVAHESQVLWIPGVSCAVGFTDEASGCRYFEYSGMEKNGSSVHSAELYKIAILDRNEQEEH